MRGRGRRGGQVGGIITGAGATGVYIIKMVSVGCISGGGGVAMTWAGGVQGEKYP